MAQRLSRRLTPFALLAAVLAAVPGPHDGARAAVPGKNGRIAFVRSAGAGPLEEVFTVSPGSGLTANLTGDPFISDTAPSWSPDGTRLAFTREGPGGSTNIMALNLGGGGEVAVTPAGGFDAAPDWSPDGARVAFARGGDQDDGLPFHIHTVGLASGRTSQVTGGKVQDLLPSWQPL